MYDFPWEDQWTEGGHYKFCTSAPPLLHFDGKNVEYMQGTVSHLKYGVSRLKRTRKWLEGKNIGKQVKYYTLGYVFPIGILRMHTLYDRVFLFSKENRIIMARCGMHKANF